MWRISIHPEWVVAPAGGDPHPLPELLPLLTAIQDSGSIADGARSTAMSYRRAWGMLRRFENEFGVPLVIKTRGQGTRLSVLAEKLLWADRRVAARLSPTLESLSSELEGELESLLAPERASLRINASHGFAVAALVEALGREGVPVELKYRTSTEAVAALARGECDLAGFHVAEGPFLKASVEPYLAWLDSRRHVLIYLAHRTQGLFVARGNPKRVSGVEDLARSDLRFVNRQIGSGTRVLLDLLLARHRIEPARVVGYENTEFTHAAVAAYIASGMADVGFGLEAAARRFGLDFIALLRERYFFGCEAAAVGKSMLRNVLTLLRGDQMRAVIDALPGYDGRLTGTVVELEEAFDAG
jgi:molybdate transport repressor ModE-like protein